MLNSLKRLPRLPQPIIDWRAYVFKNLFEKSGLLRYCTLFALLGGVTLCAGFVCWIYHNTWSSVRHESVLWNKHIRSVFLAQAESILEELAVFSKKENHDPGIIDSDKTLFFDGQRPDRFFSHWHVCFDKPLVDQRSGLWFIPARVKLLDDNNRTIGHMVKYTQMRRLTEILRQKTFQKGYVFALLDSRFGAIAQSENNPGDYKSLIYRHILKKLHHHGKKSFSLAWPNKDVTFLHAAQVPHHPYILVTGIRTSYVWNLLMARLSTFMPYLLLSCCFFLVLLWAFGYRYQKVFRRYQKVTQLYYWHMAVETVKEALTLCNAQTSLPQSFHTVSQETAEDVDINVLIKDALLMADPILSKKGLHVETRLSPKIPNVCLPSFALQKVLVSLLHSSADMCGTNGHIKIQTQHKRDYCLIAIDDSAFFLEKEDRLRLYTFTKDPFAALDFQTILNLLEELHIQITISSHTPKGNSISLEIPYTPVHPGPKEPSNILPFRK